MGPSANSPGSLEADALHTPTHRLEEHHFLRAGRHRAVLGMGSILSSPRGLLVYCSDRRFSHSVVIDASA